MKTTVKISFEGAKGSGKSSLLRITKKMLASFSFEIEESDDTLVVKLSNGDKRLLHNEA